MLFISPKYLFFIYTHIYTQGGISNKYTTLVPMVFEVDDDKK